MTGSTTLTARSTTLLDRARYLTLTISSPDGHPWAAVLQYAWQDSPLRFIFGSAVDSRHSRNITANPDVSFALHS
ncbi:MULTISPECIES: pyridoxamine 5'-phosphate oxidase family protein [unclassified Amycolatopsis]|uniref:pyridoxamine 5'-phosphate oxidase family protein n=1 Tax=unclassified Amycolatopsis TaxID=2618356 RepID=UPI0037C1B240